MKRKSKKKKSKEELDDVVCLWMFYFTVTCHSGHYKLESVLLEHAVRQLELMLNLLKHGRLGVWWHCDAPVCALCGTTWWQLQPSLINAPALESNYLPKYSSTFLRDLHITWVIPFFMLLYVLLLQHVNVIGYFSLIYDLLGYRLDSPPAVHKLVTIMSIVIIYNISNAYKSMH